MHNLATDLARVMELLEKATPGEWHWTPNRDSIQSYVEGRNEVILWPANAITETGSELRPEFREKDGKFEGYPEWFARMGACGHRAEKEAAANAELLIAAINFLRQHGPKIAETFKETPNG